MSSNEQSIDSVSGENDDNDDDDDSLDQSGGIVFVIIKDTFFLLQSNSTERYAISLLVGGTSTESSRTDTRNFARWAHASAPPASRPRGLDVILKHTG